MILLIRMRRIFTKITKHPKDAGRNLMSSSFIISFKNFIRQLTMDPVTPGLSTNDWWQMHKMFFLCILFFHIVLSSISVGLRFLTINGFVVWFFDAVNLLGDFITSDNNFLGFVFSSNSSIFFFVSFATGFLTKCLHLSFSNTWVFAMVASATVVCLLDHHLQFV